MANSVIGALRVNLGLDSAKFMRGLDKSQKKMSDFSKRMVKIGLAIKAVSTGVALAVRGEMNALDELGKASARIGVPVEALSQLRYAARQSGVEMGQLETSFGYLARRMAADAEIFERIGVTIRDEAGEMRPMEDVLEDVADAFAGMPEGADKAAAAMELFGRSGTNLIPMLDEGGEGIRELREQADRLGLTVGTEAVEAATNFNDNIGQMRSALGGLRTQIVTEMVPALERMSELVAGLAEKFGNLPPGLKRFAGTLGLITLALGPLVAGIGLVALGVSALGAPVAIAIAGFTALTAAVVAFWPRIREAWQAFVSYVVQAQEFIAATIAQAVQGIREFTDRGLNFVRESFQATVDWFRGLPGQMLGIGRDIIDGLREGLNQAWEDLKDWAWGKVPELPGVFRRLLETQSPSRVFRRIGHDLMDGLKLGMDEGMAGPMDSLSRLAGDMTDKLEKVAQRVGQSFESAFVAFVTGASSAQQAAQALLRDLARLAAQSAFRGLTAGLFGGGGPLGGLFGGLFGGTPTFGGFRAGGGPVRAGVPYVVGEHQPELFVPDQSGTIIPSLAGPVVRVVIEEGPMFAARARAEAEGVAVDVMRAGLDEFSRGPGRAMARAAVSDRYRVR